MLGFELLERRAPTLTYQRKVNCGLNGFEEIATEQKHFFVCKIVKTFTNLIYKFNFLPVVFRNKSEDLTNQLMAK